MNVLANPSFGTVVSESGQAYTWGENAHEFRLTPWHNDPVADASGEAFYLRDEESGQFWSPTPLPRRGATPYVSRHGFGYSVFEHTEAGHRLRTVGLCGARMRRSSFPCSSCATPPAGRAGCRPPAMWNGCWATCGRNPPCTSTPKSIPYSGALYARNPYNTEFPDRVAFFDADDSDSLNRSTTCDRAEFIGRNGSLANPAALARTHLSGKAGSGLDPCAAIQVAFDLADGEEREIVFRLGLGGVPGGDDANRLVQRFRGAAAARRALEAVWQYWNHTLGAVQVETPDPSLNVLANGWLLYQTLACRMWARSGYYQSGGAFGFRDQLQDAMALVHAEPGLLRDAPAAVRGPPVPRRRCPALVASARRARRAHPLFRRLPLAGPGHLPLCAEHRRHRRAGRTRALPRRPPAQSRRRFLLRPARPFRATPTACISTACSAIRHGLRFGEHGLPLIGYRRLERRHEPRRHSGQRRKRLAGLLPVRRAATVRRAGASARRSRIRRRSARARPGDCGENLEHHGWDGAWYRRA